MKNKLIKLNDIKSVMGFLKEPTIKIAEVLTGILVSDISDRKLSAGKLIQATIKGNLLTQLGREIEKYREAGEIKEDFFATDKNRISLYELLKFLDENVPDEVLFKAVKSIFFSGIGKNATQQDEVLAYEFLNTAKKLSGTEVLILKANFELNTGNFADNFFADSLRKAQTKRSVWKIIIAKQMGYGDLHAIVTKYERNLESLGLISPRGDDTRFHDEFEPTSKYRLTDMGYKFCEFMTSYE